MVMSEVEEGGARRARTKDSKAAQDSEEGQLRPVMKVKSPQPQLPPFHVEKSECLHPFMY
jgi:hypothetical protein